jgi:DNA segregation ATPase FtsK/SpoIIIE-like protein
MAEILITDDELLKAAKVVVSEQEVNSSLLQGKLGVGYGKAVALIEELERVGIITPLKTVQIREVIASNDNEVAEFIRMSGRA